MKVMILSDSHTIGKNDLLNLLKHNKVDYYIHCGDIYTAYEKLNLNNFYLARGNNDFNRNIHDELFITIDNLNFFITHGHHYDVGYNLDYLINTAKKKKADIICFGHTHCPYLSYENNLIIINPGSICYSRGQYHFGTYCILDTKTKKIVFYDVNTLKPCDPFKSKFSKKTI